MSMFDEYGHCILHKGKKLWTLQLRDWTPTRKETFFACDPSQNSSHLYRERTLFEVQLKQEVKVLVTFMCKNYMPEQAVSVLPEISQKLVGCFGDLSGVEIKARIEKRKILKDALLKREIPGWLSPRELSCYENVDKH